MFHSLNGNNKRSCAQQSCQKKSPLQCSYNHKQTQPQPHNHTHRNKHNHSRNMLAQSSHSSVTLLGATRTPRLSAHLKYVCPPTVPSFLPTGSSSSTPQRGMFFVACLP